MMITSNSRTFRMFWLPSPLCLQRLGVRAAGQKDETEKPASERRDDQSLIPTNAHHPKPSSNFPDAVSPLTLPKSKHEDYPPESKNSGIINVSAETTASTRPNGSVNTGATADSLHLEDADSVD